MARGEQKTCELSLEEIEAKLRSSLTPVERAALATARVSRLIASSASTAEILKAQKAQLRAINEFRFSGSP